MILYRLISTRPNRPPCSICTDTSLEKIEKAYIRWQTADCFGDSRLEIVQEGEDDSLEHDAR